MVDLAVVGSRSFNDYNLLKNTLDKYDINKIISGGAKGADQLAERYAKENGIETLILKPDWKKYPRAAGIIRNKDIIGACTEVVAFWDGKSPGTKNSIGLAEEMGKPCNKVIYS